MFQWSDSCKKSFQELKARLTYALVLAITDGSDGFVVYYDVSRWVQVVSSYSMVRS